MGPTIDAQQPSSVSVVGKLHSENENEEEFLSLVISRRKIRMLGLTLLALVLVFVQCTSRSRFDYDSLDPVTTFFKRRTDLDTNAKTNNNNKRGVGMLPDMSEEGGVVLFYHAPESGGDWLRFGLQDEELRRASLGHVQFEYRNASNLTELKDMYHKSSSYLENGPSPLIKKVLFVEISMEGVIQIMPIIQEWRDQTEQAGVPFFAFTLIRESISSQMALWNSSLLQRKALETHISNLSHITKSSAELAAEAIVVDHDLIENPQCQFMGQGKSCPLLYEILKQNMDWIGRTDRLGEETIPLIFQLMFGRRPQLATKLSRNFQYKKGDVMFSSLPSVTRQKIENISTWDEQLYRNASRDYFIEMWNNFVPLNKPHATYYYYDPPESYHPQGYLNPYQDPVNQQALLRRPILTKRDKPTSPYAYVIMMWGVDPDDVSDSDPYPPYTGYLANMLIANKVLQDNNSTADFVAVFKMKYGCRHDRLMPHEEEMLRSNGIKIRYIPKEIPDFYSFYKKYSPRGVQNISSWNRDASELVTKLWVYGMTDYRRVMFLDADVIPLTTLDYLFHLSEGPNALIKENIVLATHNEPANAGFFMIQPNRSAYQDIIRLVADRNDTVGVRDRFDDVQGWGHAIEAPDKWETNKPDNQGQNWIYLTASSDQGLIYHYPKYVLKSMTQILARKVINYGPGPNGTITVEKIYNVTSLEESPFYNFAPKPNTHIVFHRCCIFEWQGAPDYPGCVPPYSDHAHNTAEMKPWKHPPAPPGTPDLIFWWDTLRELQAKGVNITFQEVAIRDPLKGLQTTDFKWRGRKGEESRFCDALFSYI